MERIADLFANNPKLALVCIISLRDRAVIYKDARSTAAGNSPSDTVVNTYLNIITTAALAFDIDPSVSSSNTNNHSAGGGPQVDDSIQEEVWGLLRFRTRQWEIAAFRQDNADVAADIEANGGGSNNKGSGSSDQWMMVTFAEPSDSLGTNAGNMTSRQMAATRR